MAAGRLYIVATPIGNLGDMVPRAVSVLQAVDLIAAEDTRHSGKLFAQFAIEGSVIAYHDHNEQERCPWLVEKLLAGADVALVSDAGTPLISDPGYRLVAAAQEAGIQVVPVPGACAAIAALSVSGLASDRFGFDGFLPAKQSARLRQLASLAGETRTLIFYESPHRIVACVQDMVECFGPQRLIVVARELTKTYETVKRLPAAELLAWLQADPNQQKGEFVVLVDAAPATKQQLDAEVVRTLTLLAAELPAARAAALTARLTGVSKKQLYAWLQAQGGAA